MVIAATAAIVGLLPMLLVGALAVQLTAELGFGTAALGAVVASFRSTSAVTAPFLGRAADRLGSSTSLRVAGIATAITCIGVATTASSWGTLVPWMILGGASIGLAQPAANRLIVTGVPARRRGMAFGVKQTSAPGSSTLAGISVPVIALTIGWRYAYVMAAVLAVVVVLAVRRSADGPAPGSRLTSRPPRIEDRMSLAFFGLAFGLANAANSIMLAFYVEAAVDAGTSASLAGSLLAVAGVAAITVRLTTGIASDRMRSGHLRLCAYLMLAGALGLGLLATEQPGLMGLGLIIGLSGAWGLHAVFWFVLMNAYSATPGTATGLVATVGHTGGTLGPLLFGVVAQEVAFRVAWGIGSIFAIAAAAMMVLLGRRLSRRGPSPGEAPRKEGEMDGVPD
jgi:predicted MFS family arabinose efflux permease